MEGRLVLKDCSLFRPDGRLRPGMAVVVEHEAITQLAPDSEVPVLPGDWEVACRGRLVSAGLVDCHTRLVGGQLAARRADLLLALHRSRLEQEAHLERLLTAGEVEAISTYAMARGLRSGTTLFVEHLHAPSCVADALRAQMRAAQRVGARLVASHASTSADPAFPGPAQAEANACFVRETERNPLTRGLLGVHASSVADDDLLRELARAQAQLGVGVHFLLEPHGDELRGTQEVSRLEAFGLLGAGSLGAHTGAICSAEAQRCSRTKTMLALCLRAGSTESLGAATTGLATALAERCLLGLGTGGTGALWNEVSLAHAALLALARAGHGSEPDAALSRLCFGGPAELCAAIFGRPNGVVEVGALADLVVFDLSPTAQGDDLPYLLMQMAQAPVAWTIVNGRVAVREGQLVGLDMPELAREATRALDSVWRRAT